MIKDEALKLALEALEEAWYHVGTFQPTEKAIDLYDEARTAIKEALAQPEQEPVAWEQFYPDIGKPQIAINPEIVGYVAPQRTWVGLTDEEIEQLHIAWVLGGGFRQLCNAIEETLKEKNTRGQE